MADLTTTIRIPVNSHREAVEAAKANKLSVGRFCVAAMHYFAQRGLNPVTEHTRQTEVLVSEIRKVGNRLFGFLQEQERGLFMPLLEELIRARMLQEEAVDFSLQTLLATAGASEETLETARLKVKNRVEERVQQVLTTYQKQAPGRR